MLPASIARTSLYVPRILRLQAEIGGMFADNMDMLSLTSWRLTCRTNYEQAAASLRRMLMTMLFPFVPSPAILLDMITQHRAVFGGLFALAFVLRDRTILVRNLDIYLSDYEFEPFCTSLLGNVGMHQIITSHDYSDHTVLDALRTLVSRVLTIHTSRGTGIRVHRSYTSSATAPISHASCTALSNFVTAYGFGCSHPLLTLNRRALLTDQELPVIPVPDHELHDTLMSHDFSLRFSPTVWPEFRRDVPRRNRKGNARDPRHITPGQHTDADAEGSRNLNDATEPVPDSREASVTQATSPFKDDAEHVLSDYVGPPCVVGDASGCLTCFPVEPLVADASQVTPDFNDLGPGKLVIDFNATMSDPSRHCRYTMPSTGSSTGVDVDFCPWTIDGSTDQPTQPAAAGYLQMQHTFVADCDEKLDSLYYLGDVNQLNVDLPPSPMSRLLSVLGPTEHSGFDPAAHDEAHQQSDYPRPESIPSIFDPQVDSTADLDAFVYNAPSMFYQPNANCVTTIDPAQLFTDGHSDTTGHNDNSSSFPGPSIEAPAAPPARWSLDLRGYTYGETDSFEKPRDHLVHENAIPRADTPSHGHHIHVDPITQGTPPQVDAYPLACLPEFVNDGGASHRDDHPIWDPPLLKVHQPLPADFQARTLPVHGEMSDPSAPHKSQQAPSPVAHCMSSQPTIPQCIAGQHTVFPSSPRHTPVPDNVTISYWDDPVAMAGSAYLTHDRDNLLPATTSNQTTATTTNSQVNIGGHHLNDTDVSEIGRGETRAVEQHDGHEVDVSIVFQSPGSRNRSGAPTSAVGTSTTDVLRDVTFDGDDKSDSEADETDEYSDSADTDVYPPRPTECWRHRYICPSQGRYFGDRGSFVEYFDPLRGGEQFCAQNNIAPFGPMVIWRVLSTFNCEEGCDMYDDVLEEAVTSLPVLIRRDPFGDLRDSISNRPVVGFHKHRSLSPH